MVATAAERFGRVDILVKHVRQFLKAHEPIIA